MKNLVVGIFILGIALGMPNLGKDPSIKEFEEEFHKLYSPEEELEAEKNLKKNEEAIDKENELFEAGKANFREAVMEWDDLSSAEFLAEKTGALNDDDQHYATGLLETPKELDFNSDEDQEYLDAIYNATDRMSLPKNFDARSKGIVTSIKNQKSCGSCSAFASTAMHETCMIRAGAPKSNLDLSEQQLVDCAYDNKLAFGCKGAYIRAYPLWLANKNGGFVNHENNYPYLNSHPKLKCQNVQHWSAGAKITRAITDERCSDTKLMKLVYKYGAVVSVIYAGDNGFRNYRAGTIFDTCSNKRYNHAITVVGWGTTSKGVKYWLIKNSWGSYWGDKGYIKVKRGTCDVALKCTVSECARHGNQSKPPAKSGHQDVDPCNVSAKYGPNVTGSYTIKYNFPNGSSRSTSVNCAHSMCTPKQPGKNKNSCYIICGRSKCGK